MHNDTLNTRIDALIVLATDSKTKVANLKWQIANLKVEL